MRGTHRVAAFTAAVIGLCLTACSMDPLTLQPSYTPVSTIARVPPPACALRVVELVDRRLDPETFGMVVRAVKAPEDREAWLKDVLRGMNASGVEVSFADEPPAVAALPGLETRVELVTVWLSSMATSMAANVAFAFDYHRDGVSLHRATYRGNRTVLNWASGDGEIQRLLDDALAQVLQQAGQEALRLCTAAPPASAGDLSAGGAGSVAH